MGRPHVECERPQFIYSNEDTGVYFVFDVNEDELDTESGESPLSLNINYFRPSYFALEAAPEIELFVKEFDLTVVDPQIGGMGEGEFNAAAFIAGWNKGNEFGYRACLTGESAEPQKILSVPAATQMEVWRWNLGRGALQEALGLDVFVPRVSFMMADGALSTVSVWPDGIPIACRRVDRLLIGREKFAPKRFFVRRKDLVLVGWEQAAPWLEKYRSRSRTDCILLDYLEPPADLAAFIEGLPAKAPDLAGVSHDQVLDREMVEAAFENSTGQKNSFD